MEINKNNISQNPKKKALITGVLTVVAVLSVGFSIGIVTGVINVPFAEACCVLPPPPVVVPPPVVIPPTVLLTPSCSITATHSTITAGETTTLSWTIVNAVAAQIDNGIGSVGLTDTHDVSPTETTIYNMVVDGPGGEFPCSTKVTVVPPVTPPTPDVPSCALTVSPASYVGTSTKPTLSWTTSNATTFTIDHGIGSVTPVASGSTLAPIIIATTTYSGTATGPGGTSAPCTATITVTPPVVPGAPSCTLTAAPDTFVDSGAPVLSWTTTNADSFSIDQGVAAIPAASLAAGSTTAPTIATTTTYTGTAVNAVGSFPCTAVVTVTNTPVTPTLACTLSADPSTLGVGGGTSVLSWTTTNAATFSIDNGVGAIASTTLTSGTTTTPTITSDTTFTGTVTDTSGATKTCTAPVTVQTGGGGCTSGCGGGGGGGGGGGSHPNITLSVLKQPQALAFVYLSQIPYTGLDLGPVGTVVYWLALIVWSLAAAYLTLFVVIPFIIRRTQRFATAVSTTLNAEQPLLETVTAPVFSSAPMYSAPVGAPQVSKQASQTQEDTREYSAYDGFRSFAKAGALSVDDIVKGLSQESNHTEPVYENVEPIYSSVDPIQEPVAAPVQNSPRPMMRERSAPAADIAPEVPSFIAAIIRGDRETVFNTLRSVVRTGGDAEAFLTQSVCALDDAYRARLDGTRVHPEIARVTSECAAAFLERLVTALSTAVDSSYSSGITGAKLALTRALAIVGA